LAIEVNVLTIEDPEDGGSVEQPRAFETASRVALAEELGTPDIFTLDLRGFSVYRWRKRRAFRIHPAPA
jgi:hypothetical protein